MGEEVRRDLLAKATVKGFAGKLGLELIEVTPGHAVVEMTPCADDTNIHGTVHGGAIFSLMDEAFQMACNSHGTVAVALSVNVVYHRPARGGQRLRAASREIHSSPKIATYDIRVTDEEDDLIASCQAVAYRKKEPLPFLVEGG